MSDLLAAASTPFAPLIGVAPLMRRAFQHEDLRPIGAALLQRAQDHPDDANALLDFSTVLQLTGDRAGALAIQAEAIAMQPLYSLSCHVGAPGIRLLVLMGPGDLMSNTPVEFLLEGADVAVDVLFVSTTAPFPDSVPDHDVLLVALAESTANQPLLAQVAELVRYWPRPVINPPERIAVLSRDGVCAVLAGIAGVLLPLTARADRATVQALATSPHSLAALLPGDDFPLIVRPVGSHAGHDLLKIPTPADLPAYLAAVDSAQFYVSRFIDYSSGDGLFRKYRVALIEGVPYICHFAISSHWMVHYLNAGMDDSADKRQQEADCMAHFDAQFATRHAAALAAINERMGLPYLGIDCAETPSGQLLIFEVDNAMVVHAMEADPKYAYKKPVMQKVFDGFRRLLENARNGMPDA